MEPIDETPKPIYRCPHCDSVVASTATQCLMCGQQLTHLVESTAKDSAVENKTAVEAADHQAEKSEDGLAETSQSTGLTEEPAPLETTVSPPIQPESTEEIHAPTPFIAVMRERQSRATFFLTAVFIILVLIPQQPHFTLSGACE